MKSEKEKGAIVVEATIALTAYIFAIFTILSVVNICYIQSKIGVSLNAAAKELSQYSYLYYKLGLGGAQQGMHEENGEARATAEQTLDGLETLVGSLSGAQGNLNTGNFDGLLNEINKGAMAVDSLATLYGDKLAEDPKAFIIGMGKLAGEALVEKAKSVLAAVMAKSLMKKNLVSGPGDSTDAFLKRWGIEDGMSGLDFEYSTIMPYGKPDIILCVTYEVKVIRLLNLEYSFKFRQFARTRAWGAV